MAKPGLTSIIILNYNGTDFLKNCIDSILKETNKEIEIIVVDNNSPDNSGKKYSNEYSQCKFILNKKNLGVPEGLNVGIKNSNGEFIVLLNNDLIVTPGWLDGFFSAYEKYGVALYQPKFLKMKNINELDGTGNMINLFGFAFARAKGKQDLGQYEKTEEVSYASGTCMFIPRKIIDEIGLFDGKFFAYHEEVDFGWRARLFGYKSHYVPSTIIHHFGSAQWKWSDEKFYLLERNRWFVLLKNYSLKTLIQLFPSLLIIELFMLAFFAKKGMFLKKIQSYGSIIKLYKTIIKDRKNIQKNRKISDEEIIKSFCCNVYIPPESEEADRMQNFNSLLINLSKLSGFYKKLRIVE